MPYQEGQASPSVTPIACVLSLALASALARGALKSSSATLRHPMTRTTISFNREGMDPIREAANRQGAAQLRAIGDQGPLVLLAFSWGVFLVVVDG